MEMKEILPLQSPKKDSIEDASLVESSLKGDTLSFGCLIDKYWEILAIIIYNRLRNHADTEDVLQETFIKAYRKLSSLKDPLKFGPWLYHVAITTSIDWIRKESRHSSLSLEDVHEDCSADSSSDKDYLLEEHVLKAVQSLPEKYQIVVTLRYFKGMSYQEITDHLGEPAGTISNRLHRANKLLKEWMDYPEKE